MSRYEQQDAAGIIRHEAETVVCDECGGIGQIQHSYRHTASGEQRVVESHFDDCERCNGSGRLRSGQPAPNPRSEQAEARVTELKAALERIVKAEARSHDIGAIAGVTRCDPATCPVCIAREALRPALPQALAGNADMEPGA